MINAGEFNQQIEIKRSTPTADGDGFTSESWATIATAWASVSTTKGFTLITNRTNFEEATTGMLIRKPAVAISRKDRVVFKGIEWTIEYLNEIDHDGAFIELQVKEVRQNG